MLVPDAYRKLSELRGRPLADLGVAGSAFAKLDALAAIEALKGSQVAILGGDVLSFVNGRLRYAKANWYVNREPNEVLADFLARSWQRAEQYVLSFPEPEDGSVLYALVISELGT